jgi:hypothetical protein
MRFSQRIGKRPIKTVLQVESIDLDLKNRLWNILLEDFFKVFADVHYRGSESERGEICKIIWKEFFGFAIDKIARYSNVEYINSIGFIDYIRKWFYEVEWYDVYDLLEFISCMEENYLKEDFIERCNRAFEKEISGYRIINSKIVQITSESEILEIEEAIINTDKWKSVNTHLSTALDFLADRKSPDYRNSIKESISAVESMCKIITNDNSATLGKALSEIEKKNSLHGALKNAFSALYGFTSDAGGMRHSLLEDDIEIGFEDAKFMLVSCSAFINYLKIKI